MQGPNPAKSTAKTYHILLIYLNNNRQKSCHCFMNESNAYITVTVVDLVFILLDCKSGKRNRYVFSQFCCTYWYNNILLSTMNICTHCSYYCSMCRACTWDKVIGLSSCLSVYLSVGMKSLDLIVYVGASPN